MALAEKPRRPWEEVKRKEMSEKESIARKPKHRKEKRDLATDRYCYFKAQCWATSTSLTESSVNLAFLLIS